MIFERLYDSDLAQSSFLIGCSDTGKALVVDPRRDLEPYFRLAREHDLTITDVAETHLHADFLSGGRELARATGARFWHSAEGDESWQYSGLDGLDAQAMLDGDRIELGRCSIEAVHTPGHTPEHLSFLLYDGEQAIAGLTGDFLFVGTLGRPDLIDATGLGQNQSEKAARTLYASAQRAMERFPHEVPLWPGHGAGSACGKSIGALPTTTLAMELAGAEWALFVQKGDTQGFIHHILSEQPESPTYFRRMKEENRDGFELRERSARPSRAYPHLIQRALCGDFKVLDLRPRDDFQRAHLKGSLHLPLGPHFATWSGWVLPEREPLLLITGSGMEADRAAAALLHVGHDAIVGFLPFEALPRAELTSQPHLEIEEAHQKWQAKEATFLDIRGASEWRQGYIPGALHHPLPLLTTEIDAIPRDRDLIVTCGSGRRAAVATSLLHAHGITRASVFHGSMEAWTKAHLPTETPRHDARAAE
ncbi:MBL fold metallo-hydrolase [Lujinxingia sediminis]|uniref:MBL fold metallo-hydrolase n=1 Tax=Lujinxingia sediminis TaxID=2480984 RepID=A0ABY0CSC7_9DELT|nr:MBL fold metallo-hydrolase [Lujinxingia sediminis]RVU43188.1 MBL fold metallo-hydrolase [Lujinxingia sediminis]